MCDRKDLPMKRTEITTDCVCDLPEEYLRARDVDVMYFYINTDTGRFKDGFVLTSANLLEYLEEGGRMARTAAPEPREYKEFFERKLANCDELIHIAMSSHVGLSCQNANRALNLMGEEAKRVTVIDSHHLSTGMGHMVVRAVEMRDEGRSAAEIVRELEELRGRISTSFITRNAEYLFRNGWVSDRVRGLCARLRLHPVLAIKNGRMTVKMLFFGNYENAVMRYTRGQLKHYSRIDTTRLFVTHAGSTVKMVTAVKTEAQKLCAFDEVIVTKASATISGNCGPGTVGVIFVNL